MKCVYKLRRFASAGRRLPGRIFFVLVSGFGVWFLRDTLHGWSFCFHLRLRYIYLHRCGPGLPFVYRYRYPSRTTQFLHAFVRFQSHVHYLPSVHVDPCLSRSRLSASEEDGECRAVMVNPTMSNRVTTMTFYLSDSSSVLQGSVRC